MCVCHFLCTLNVCMSFPGMMQGDNENIKVNLVFAPCLQLNRFYCCIWSCDTAYITHYHKITVANVFNNRENNNTDSVCVLVLHFILFSIDNSIVFSRTEYKTHTSRV